MTTPLNPNIPAGFCQCGCGKKTNLARQTMKSCGWVAGLPVRFIAGHQGFKRRPVEEARPFKIDGVYCRLIPLTQGMYAIVDEPDYLWLSQYRWQAIYAESAKCFYAQRVERIARKQKSVLMHRQILGLQRGDPREGDHVVAGTGWDNRRKNLRIASPANNCQNQRKSSRNTSGMRGVNWDAADKAYVVRIMVSGRRYRVGSSRDFEKACHMRIAALLKFHQEFANDGTNWQDRTK